MPKNTYEFVMDVTETVAYIYSFSVEADSQEEAEQLLQDDPYDYEDNCEHIETLEIDKHWDTLDCTETTFGRPTVDLCTLIGYPSQPIGGNEDDE